MNREIRNVTLHAPSDASARHAATLLEDAFRTVSIPFEESRLIYIRELAVGEIDTRRASSALAIRIGARLAGVVSSAIPATDARSASAPAVIFTDEIEPFVIAARRIARHQPLAEWFWPECVPVRQLTLRAFVEAIAAKSSAGPLAVAPFLQTIQEEHTLEALLPGFTASDAASIPLLPAAQPHLTATLPPKIDQLWEETLTRWIPVWGEPDPRSEWLATAALIAPRPTRLTAPSAVLAAAKLLIKQVLREGQAFVQNEPKPRPPTARTSIQNEPNRLPPVRPDPSAVPVPIQNEPKSAPPTAAVPLPTPVLSPTPDPSPALEPPPATEFAGLLFLAPVLERIGAPILEEGWPDLFFQTLADRFEATPDDPIRRFLSPDLPVGPDPRPWIIESRRWLRRNARIGLLSLVRRPGRIAVTRTHLDIYLPLDTADIRIRRAGLDLDPGWIPWLGKVVRFIYW